MYHLSTMSLSVYVIFIRGLNIQTTEWLVTTHCINFISILTGIVRAGVVGRGACLLQTRGCTKHNSFESDPGFFGPSGCFIERKLKCPLKFSTKWPTHVAIATEIPYKAVLANGMCFILRLILKSVKICPACLSVLSLCVCVCARSFLHSVIWHNQFFQGA